ncbi:membrane cofactor protein-like isoform X2 [Stigmatopora argus]
MQFTSLRHGSLNSLIGVLPLPDSAMDVASLFLLLFYLDVSMVAQAQDCSAPAVGSNMHLKEILKDTFADGSIAPLTCDVGYSRVSGSDSIICTAGAWSQVTLECERINCGSAGNVPNGQYDYSEGTQFGDKIYINCNPGYILVGVASDRTCLANMQWSNHPPSCQVVTCDPPEALDKGSFSPITDIYHYDNVIQYTCMDDYVLNGSSTAVCSADKTFKPNPPVCIKVRCVDLQIPNAEIVSGAGPPYTHKASVTFQCLPEYKMVGSASPTCDINSHWSPNPPTCIETTSTTTETPDVTDTPTGNSSHHWGKSVGIAVGVIIGIVIICAGCYYFGGLDFITKKNKKGKLSHPAGTTLLEMGGEV